MDLKALFYPESVAVIGASDNLGGGKIPYFHILQANGYRGKMYPVNPKYQEIGGVKAYASLEELPDGVDFTIVSAPAQQSLDIVRTASRKNFKFIHFFTSGFSETGNAALEEEMVAAARSGGLRIVGPNCIGVHCTESGLSFLGSLSTRTPGAIAFLGQSGGITGNFMGMALSRKIPLNKVVSYGNQIDIRVEDYLDYFATDDGVRLVACYVEDIKDTRAFLDVLRRTTASKPVVILKGGKTASGSQAAASHTGAMASDYVIWAAAARQHGAVLVDDFDQLMHAVMMGAAPQQPRGKRLGFVGAGGGVSVLFADMAVEAGFSLPELGERTQARIAERIRGINTSTTNPVDLGAYGFDLSIMLHTMKALDEDDCIDVVVPYFSVEYILHAELLLNVKNSEQPILDMAREMKKPVVPILANFVEDNLDMERTRIATFAALRKAGFPVYSKIQDAVYALKKSFEWTRSV